MLAPYSRGFTTLELLLILVVLCLAVATFIPAYLSSRQEVHQVECGYKLAVVKEAKKQVFDDMNRLLPPENRLRITDPVNLLHIDKISKLTYESPWRFRPEDPFSPCGMIYVGETFLDPPYCTKGYEPIEVDSSE